MIHKKFKIFLPVKDFIAAVEDLRFGIMISSNELISKGLQSSNFLLLYDRATLVNLYNKTAHQFKMFTQQ